MDVVKFASRIKAERNNQNMSQIKLAELIGIDHTALSRIENGKVDITVGTILKIAAALNVPAEYLLLDFIPESYSNSNALLRQIEKLCPEQKKTLVAFILILTQNNERWRTVATNGNQNGNAPERPPNNIEPVSYIEIGKRIRSHRRQTQLTQEKLSELAGISASFLGSIERGEEKLSVETLFKIANALHQPVSKLLINANRDAPLLGLCDAVEELARTNDEKSILLLNLLAVLVDNSDKW